MNEDIQSINSKDSAAEFRAELAKLEQEHFPEEPTEAVIEESVEAEEIEEATEEEIQEEPETMQEEEDDVTNDKIIPRKRLNKEIERRKALEAQLQAEREEKIRFQTELNLYNRAIEKLNSNEAANKQSNEPEIDPVDEDAHRYYMARIKQLEQKVEGASNKLTQSEDQRTFEATLNQHQAEFSKKTPDFEEAYKYLLNAELNNAKLVYGNEKESQQAVLQKLAQVSYNSINNGRNAANVMYTMAKNYGYSAKPKGSAPKPDLNAIESNMRKSKGIDDIPSVPVNAANGAGNYTRLNNFDRLMNKDGYGVDKDAFHKVLEQIRRGG